MDDERFQAQGMTQDRVTMTDVRAFFDSRSKGKLF
jgi:hypothetical protein